MSTVPEHSRRHFAGDPGDLDDDAVRGFVTARLLEDGDREDLAWWTARVGRRWIRSWIERHARRRLSRRSRRFWLRAAGSPSRPENERATELWPLA